MKEYTNPWLFQGKPFDEKSENLAGFVYLIVDEVTGKKYLGKKYFWSHRTPPGKKRKRREESDWKRYYGSNEELKQLVKEHGENRFRRYILSLHTLKRDVNYEEVRQQFVLGVLEETDAAGNSLWYNDSINGKWRKSLVMGIRSRTTSSG